MSTQPRHLINAIKKIYIFVATQHPERGNTMYLTAKRIREKFPDAVIESGAVIGSIAVIGRGAWIGSGAVIESGPVNQ
jgi:UDP-3-O-[3-hydroxymyristoyl] glucosamine N-acyltransferase